MRNRAGALVALVIAGAFTGSAAAQDVQTLKIACVLDAQHPLMVGGRRMAEIVERESKGRLKIALYPSSQLGGQREVLAERAGRSCRWRARSHRHPDEFRAAVRRHRPALSREGSGHGLSAVRQSGFRAGAGSAGGRRGLSRGARLGGDVPQRLHAREGDQQRGRPEEPETAGHPEPVLYSAVPCAGGGADPDGVRRGLHRVAAGRHRRRGERQCDLHHHQAHGGGEEFSRSRST